MIERTLAKRYAAALLAALEKDGNVEEAESNLLALKEVYEKLPAFRQTLTQPRLTRETRKAFLRRAFEGKVGKSFLEFLDLLVEKKRTDLLPDIADAFDRLADASRGVVRVKARTFRPLDNPGRAALKKKLTTITGKKVDIEETVDPTLKGGMLVQIGDTVIDGSVAGHLKELRERLTRTSDF